MWTINQYAKKPLWARTTLMVSNTIITTMMILQHYRRCRWMNLLDTIQEYANLANIIMNFHHFNGTQF